MEPLSPPVPGPRPSDLAAAAARKAQAIDLLVWDAPNVDMTLSNVIGRKATADVRPRYDGVARWFMAEVGQREAKASVFSNYNAGTAHMVRPWLEAVRAAGLDVFMRPKLQPDDDVDEAMLAHVDELYASVGLHRLVVVSGDGRCFLERLLVLADAGVDVLVVTFVEVAGWARQEPTLRFMDLEEIPGAFREPLPNRIRLEELPPEGAWLAATKPLTAYAPTELITDETTTLPPPALPLPAE